MDQHKQKWNVTIKRLLERAAYDLDHSDSTQEIRARTGLSELEVKQVLEGSRQATIEGIYRIAEMLNVPAGDLINQTNSVIQCYSIDGGRPRTLSLSPEDRALTERVIDIPLLYAEDLDGSYPLFPNKTMIVFVNRQETPVVDGLYLFENQHSRYVRRCAFIDVSTGDAAMTDDGAPGKITILKKSKIKRVDSKSEVLMGQVIMSVKMH